jgi:co-chaperonin GroES (HSP10)
MNVIYENILVEATDDATKPGGVYVPEEEQDRVFSGKVVKFGEAVPESVQELLKSQPIVEYKEYYDGAEKTIDKKKYIVMSFKDILIIL